MNQLFLDLEKGITDLLIKYRGIQSSIESTKQSIDEVDQKLIALNEDKSALQICRPIIDDIINKSFWFTFKKVRITAYTWAAADILR